MTTTLRHTHTSSRFDRSNDSLRTAISSFMKNSDIITITEVSAERRERVLRALGREHGWGVQTGDKSGNDDSAVMWDKSQWRRLYGETRMVFTKHYATTVILEHVTTKHKILVSTCHMPARVDRGGKFAGIPSQIKYWYGSQKGWKNLWNALARQFKVKSILVSADWNVNIKSRFFRAVFKARQPGMRPTLNYKKLPKSGTHGGRLIDFSFIRGKIAVKRRPVILAQNPSSDHRPYREVFTLTP